MYPGSIRYFLLRTRCNTARTLVQVVHSGSRARNMSIKSRLIIVITFLPIVGVGVGMLGTLAAALFGYFLISHIYRDLGGEPYETAGETGRQSDRGGDWGLLSGVPSSPCPTRRSNMRPLLKSV